jgi:hypothetical protein
MVAGFHFHICERHRPSGFSNCKEIRELIEARLLGGLVSLICIYELLHGLVQPVLGLEVLNNVTHGSSPIPLIDPALYTEIP